MLHVNIAPRSTRLCQLETGNGLPYRLKHGQGSLVESVPKGYVIRTTLYGVTHQKAVVRLHGYSCIKTRRQDTGWNI